jgi:hypothetical protein
VAVSRREACCFNIKSDVAPTGHVQFFFYLE